MSATAFQRSVLASDALMTQFQQQEQDTYHKDCIKKSLAARFPKASCAITREFTKLSGTTDTQKLFQILAPLLTVDSIASYDDLETEGDTLKHTFFGPLDWKNAQSIIRSALQGFCTSNPARQVLDAATLVLMTLIASMTLPNAQVINCLAKDKKKRDKNTPQHQPEELRLSRDDIHHYINILSTPVFTDLWLRDWPAHMHMCELLFDALNIHLSDHAKKQMPEELTNLCRAVLAFERAIPPNAKSSQCMGDLYKREFRIHTYLKQYTEAFVKLNMAIQSGNTEAFFDLALAHLEAMAFTSQFTCFDYGFRLLELTQKFTIPAKHDSHLHTVREGEIENLFLLPFKGGTINLGKDEVVRIILNRYFGLDCKKDRRRFDSLVTSAEPYFSGTCQFLRCIVHILEHPDKPLPRCNNLPSITRTWLQGKNHEQRHQLNKALDCYTKVAGSDPFLAGWAPIRVAIALHMWPVALQYSQKLLQAWPDEYNENDKELLLDTIADLSERTKRSPTDIDELVMLIEDAPKQGKTAKAKQRKKKKTVISNLTAEQKPTTEIIQQDSPSSQTEHQSVPPKVKQRSVITVPVSQKVHDQYHAFRHQFHLAVLNRNLPQAQALLDQFPETQNPIYKARKTQHKCWLMLQQCLSPGHLHHVAGRNHAKQQQEKVCLRAEAENLALCALADLLHLNGEEKEWLYTAPEQVFDRLALSPEVQCIAASLLSTLGHCFCDHALDFPWLTHLREKKKLFFDCADAVNPWRRELKAGRALGPDALQAMNF